VKVLITNTVILNGGDAAILIALIRQVRNVFGGDVDIVVADTQPDLARAYYPDLNIIAPVYLHAFPPRKDGMFPRLRGAIRFARWYSSGPRLYLAAYTLGRGLRLSARALTSSAEWASLREYDEADVIISTGGTYLVENYWLAPRIMDFRIALLLGKPLVLYTQSMGPFVTPSIRRALSDIFRNAALILLRDEESLENLYDLCDPNEVEARQAADAVFALADPAALLRGASREMDNGLRIAVSVRDWPYFKSRSTEEGMRAYKDAVAGLVDHTVHRHGGTVTFISTCQGVPEYAYDDSAVASEIVDRLSDDVRARVSVDSDFHRPEDLLRRLSEFDLVVATRMHVAILALAAGTPVITISYEFKTRSLFERLGMGEFVHDIESVSASELGRSLDHVLEALPTMRREFASAVESERRRGAAAEEYLDAVRHTLMDQQEAAN
jgi:colanic acid/amylovoran biosynthesis protein